MKPIEFSSVVFNFMLYWLWDICPQCQKQKRKGRRKRRNALVGMGQKDSVVLIFKSCRTSHRTFKGK